MKNIKCEIIQDLITLYIDDLASDGSKELVEEHIKSCSECKEFLENIKKEENLDLKDIVDEVLEIDKEVEVKLVKKIQKSKINFSMILIILTCAISTALNYGSYIFAGIIILPTIGAISYLKLRNVWIAPVTIFLSNVTLLLVRDLRYEIEAICSSASILEGVSSLLRYILSIISFNIIFAWFASIGVIIGILIKKIFIDD